MAHADAFRWISVVVSIILGLGIARLLTAAVAQFHARRHRSLDWLPFVWAGVIFLQQIAFWWSLEELATKAQGWSFASFLVLVGLVLTLFLSAALVLPNSEGAAVASLRDFFAQDGRFALLMLAAFNLLALAADLVLWREPLLSASTAFNAALVALPLAAFAARRRWQEVATLVYVATAAAAILTLSPGAY
ncbi:hypothetical protein [Alsobacter sp. R-9]